MGIIDCPPFYFNVFSYYKEKILLQIAVYMLCRLFLINILQDRKVDEFLFIHYIYEI